MAGEVKKIYGALLEGAESGKTGENLYRHVKEKHPKATSKRIVKASLLALSDPDVRDESMLKVIYALAIRHRLDPVEDGDFETTADTEPDETQARPDQAEIVPDPAPDKPIRAKRSRKASKVET